MTDAKNQHETKSEQEKFQFNFLTEMMLIFNWTRLNCRKLMMLDMILVYLDMSRVSLFQKMDLKLKKS